MVAIRRLYEHRPCRCFFDPARCCEAQAVTGVRRGRVATMLTHAGMTSLLLMIAGAVLRRRLADDLGETRTERAERCAAHGDARVGDRHPLTQQRLCPLDAPCHEVGVGRLAIRGTELAREVCRRHQGGTRHSGHIERQRVVAVHEVACSTQVHEGGHFLRRHTEDGTRPWSVERVRDSASIPSAPWLGCSASMNHSSAT